MVSRSAISNALTPTKIPHIAADAVIAAFQDGAVVACASNLTLCLVTTFSAEAIMEQGPVLACRPAVVL